ncbi:hypothetical protein M5689_011275 [Euphorbia peplus]|nr:hypothetical protein M5689_011275 [Euphorbia peplus]
MPAAGRYPQQYVMPSFAMTPEQYGMQSQMLDNFQQTPSSEYMLGHKSRPVTTTVTFGRYMPPRSIASLSTLAMSIPMTNVIGRRGSLILLLNVYIQ